LSKRSIILFSALIGLVALVGGLLGIAQRSADYEATASVLIVPTTTDAGLSISAVDTLSRGPVSSTFSEAFASSEVIDAAYAKAGIDAAEASQVNVTSSVVTDTSGLLISATSDSPVLAERAANAVAQSKPDLGGYTVAFATRQIGTADGTAARSGPSSSTLVIVAIVIAGILALATAAVLGRVFPPPPAQSGDGSDIVIPTRTREQPTVTRRP
jgi:hypothetical protein